ncbi:EEF1A lysine methyltransferase 2 isoform X2 [Sorex araneus]|uniref:EEF1A lysine methyltransferase 2 isoform X2 n=1 Tax=Sorex araneus TaxID=42254 RepID=UPI00243367E9|nr:EEF1A lysine methyltransferase 2 isoform X2 [Sorex araneus]
MSAGGGGGGRGSGVAARSRDGSPGGDGFAPSALGTREHWDSVYERELETFQEYGDCGEIWFGEESMHRLIRWMQKAKIPLDAAVLDIGTGNGVFLVELAKCGFSNITGIDYSPSAIRLSGRVIEKEGLANITLKAPLLVFGSDPALACLQRCCGLGPRRCHPLLRLVPAFTLLEGRREKGSFEAKILLFKT